MAKIRNGFVSNSSSCSFVIIGVKMSNTDIMEKFNIGEDDDFYDCLEDTDFDFVNLDDDYIIGKKIAYGSDYEITGSDYSFDELKQISEEIKEKLSSNDVKLYTGSEMC